MMISRRLILEFLGLAGTDAVLSKLSPVVAKPIPVPPEPEIIRDTAEWYMGKGRPDLIGQIGDIYVDFSSPGYATYQKAADGTWLHIGGIVDERSPQIVGEPTDPAFPPVIKRGGDHV